MKANLLTHAMGALLICIGVSACTDQGSARQEAQAPYVAPETTTPAQQPEDMTAQTDPYGTTTDPYATTEADPYATAPQTEDIDAMTGDTDAMTGDTDIGESRTTGDTMGDRCAGLSGPALNDCLETERLRQQDMEDPTLMQDEDMPEQ